MGGEAAKVTAGTRVPSGTGESGTHKLSGFTSAPSGPQFTNWASRSSDSLDNASEAWGFHDEPMASLPGNKTESIRLPSTVGAV